MTLNNRRLSREGKEETVGPKRERVGRRHQAEGPEPGLGEDDATQLNGEVRTGGGSAPSTPKATTATGSWPSGFPEAEGDVT